MCINLNGVWIIKKEKANRDEKDLFQRRSEEEKTVE